MKSKTYFTSVTGTLKNKKKLPMLFKTAMVIILLSVSLWQCRKEDMPVVYPKVTSTYPISNSTGTTVNGKISATFSTEMDPSSFSAGKFTLMQGTTNVPGTVEYSGVTASFNPSADLAPNTLYKATLTTGILDLTGTKLKTDYVWSFTTGASVAVDIILPRINASDPLNNATGVVLNRVVSLTFSEAIDPLTINSTTFTLKQGTNSVSGNIAYSGNIASFTPAATLSPGLVYTATISGAKDLAGNVASDFVWSFTTKVSAAIGAVDLGAAANYVILAKSAISNVATSAITGDLGLSPAATSYITGLSLINATGYATSAQVTGSIFAADMADPTPVNLTTAVNNMVTAYNDAAGRPSPDFVELGTGNIGGKTLAPGLYKWTSSVTMPSDVTLSGNTNDVWIFQIAQNLSVSNGVNITLTGGAQAKNIFWQVAGTVLIGTTSHFEGIVLSMTGITLQTGATFKGRALAQTAVVLDGNAVIKPE